MMLEKLVLTTADEFFTELLFGTGGWLGLILILSIMFLVAVKVKYSGMFFSAIALFLGIQYFSTLGTDNNLMWCGVLSFLAIPFLLLASWKVKGI